MELDILPLTHVVGDDPTGGVVECGAIAGSRDAFALLIEDAVVERGSFDVEHWFGRGAHVDAQCIVHIANGNGPGFRGVEL